jgi:hypothetical protein
MIAWANGMAERRQEDQLALATTHGLLSNEVRDNVDTVDLRSLMVIASLPALVRYLKKPSRRITFSINILQYGCDTGPRAINGSNTCRIAAVGGVLLFGVGAWRGRFSPQMPQVWPLAAKAIAFFAVAYVCCFLIGKLPLSAIWLCAVSATIGAVVCGFSARCLDVGGVRQVARTTVVGRLFAG